MEAYDETLEYAPLIQFVKNLWKVSPHVINVIPTLSPTLPAVFWWLIYENIESNYISNRSFNTINICQPNENIEMGVNYVNL